MLAFESWVVLPITAGLSVVLCSILIPIAERFGLLDHPNERKVHMSATPLLGGGAIYLATFTAIIFFTPYGLESLPLLAACGLMLVTGMLDDLHDLSAITRLAMQILASFIMIFACDVVLTSFGKLFWDGIFELGWLSVPITIFATLGVINAFNMMDGIDGLAAMVFIVAGSALAWLAYNSGNVFNASILSIAVSATLGFFMLNARLPWNKQARVFLGDSGSLFLGLFLAWQCIDLGSLPNRAFSPMTAVWLLAIPLVDTIRLIVHRWRLGKPAMQADTHHLHHAFLKAGFSVFEATISITMLVLFTTTIGLTGEILAWPSYNMFYGFLAFGSIYLYIMHRCWKHGRFLGRNVASEIQ